MQDAEHSDVLIEVKGTHTTAEDEFYHDLGGELFKKTLPLLNDVLSKLLTVSIALSGGSAFFLGDAGYPQWTRITAAMMFVLASVSSLFGVNPLQRHAED